MSHHPSHPQAPPSPPQTPRSPPGPIGYAISTRHQSYDDGDSSMDESMMMRNIWLKLGLLDTINYKIDATLKKLGMLENRMDRLENLVRESGTVGGASGGNTHNETRNDTQHEMQPNGINLPDIMSTSSKDPISPAPRKLPKPAKRQPNFKPLVPIRPAPTAVPTAIPTVISQATPISPQPAPVTIDNVLPRSCTLHTTNKEECESKLRAYQHNGMYLIRNSEKGKGKVLMVWFHEANICKHYKIFGNQTSCFQLDETPSFSSMVDLLHHYSQHTLPQSTVLLTRPFPG